MRQEKLGLLLILVLMAGIAPQVEGFIIESPKEGSTIVIGEPFQWKIRLEPGEVCETISEQHFPFNKATGLYEWTDVLKPESKLGRRDFFLTGEPSETCDDLKAEVTLNVVLPPTTVVVGINAVVGGDKDTILRIYRTAEGELVQGMMSTDWIGVGGMYSDGVRRGIVDDPQLTYTSTNEKVAIVTPASEKTGGDPLVTAVGRGVADIIVQYGSFKSVLPVKVWECPYEGKDEIPSRDKCKR